MQMNHINKTKVCYHGLNQCFHVFSQPHQVLLSHMAALTLARLSSRWTYGSALRGLSTLRIVAGLRIYFIAYIICR